MAKQTAKEQTGKLEDSFVPALIMYSQHQATLEGAIYMLKQACREAGLKFVETYEATTNGKIYSQSKEIEI